MNEAVEGFLIGFILTLALVGIPVVIWFVCAAKKVNSDAVFRLSRFQCMECDYEDSYCKVCGEKKKGLNLYDPNER